MPKKKIKDYDWNTQCEVCGAVNGRVEECWRCGAKLYGEDSDA